VRISEESRASFLGISVAVSLVGALAAYIIGGLLGGMGWRVPFAIHLITVPFAFACLFIPKGEVTQAASKAAEDEPFSVPVRLPALAFLAGLVMFLPPIYIPFQLRDIGTDDPKVISLYLALSTVIAGVASSFYGRLRMRLDIYQSLALALVLVSSGLGLLSLASSSAAALFAMFVYGSGLGHIAPNIYALLAQVPEPERARTVGFAQGIKFIAPPAGVFALEPVMKMGGAHATLIALAMVGYLMMAYVLIDRAPFRARAPEAVNT
jgi:predicted MFS family arabinose efflux permease